MSTCCIDFDPPTLFSEEWRKARKEHVCCECGSVIHAGDEYEYIRQLYEGMWETYKTCEACADLRDSLSEVTCVYFMGLSEAFTEYLNESSNLVVQVKAGSHAAKLVPSHYLPEDV